MGNRTANCLQGYKGQLNSQQLQQFFIFSIGYMLKWHRAELLPSSD